MAEFDYFGLGNIVKEYDFTDKHKNTQSYITYMLNRVMQMFEYTGLPDTIPKRMLEMYIMVNGHAVVIKHEGNLYVCFGSWGGEPDEYYIPKNYIVANPYLNLFKTYNVNEDCILVYNDSMYYGLMPLFRRYATAFVENDLSLNMMDINTRVIALVEAQDDKTRSSAIKFFEDIKDGKQGVVASTAFFDGLRSQPYGEHNKQRLTDLIEYHQYIKASWFNEMGLNANYNMKREAINSNESQLNDDMLLPLVDNMFECRKEFVNRINEMFGTNISVDWSSSWKYNIEETELELEEMKEGDNNAQKVADEGNISADDE